MAGKKGMKPHQYTEAQLTFLRLECEMPRKELTEAFNRRFGTSLTESAIKGTCKRNGWNTGRTGYFQKGNTSWNAGKKGWQAGGRSASTRFRKGQKPHTWNPIGHERVTKEGYLQRKVTDTGYTPADYVEVHRLLWEEHNGPIPEGHIVIFKDGDRTNIEIDNLMLISRGENAVMNKLGMGRLHPDLKEAAVNVARLRMKSRERMEERRA
jgi:hypothetical protein